MLNQFAGFTDISMWFHEKMISTDSIIRINVWKSDSFCNLIWNLSTAYSWILVTRELALKLQGNLWNCSHKDSTSA